MLTSSQLIISCVPTYGVLFHAFSNTISSRNNQKTNPYGSSHQLSSNVHATGGKVSKSGMFASQNQNQSNTAKIRSEEENEYAESEEHILGER